MLAVDVQIGLGDRIRIERAVRASLDRAFIVRALHDATVNTEVGHMDVLWRKLACQALS